MPPDPPSKSMLRMLGALCISNSTELYSTEMLEPYHFKTASYGPDIVKAVSILDKVPDSLGMKCYLKVIHCVVDSFSDKSLSPLSKIWYPAFFLRSWRQWLLVNHNYTFHHRKCIELNAHAIIIILITLRDHFKSGYACFIPWLLGFQTCETTFRNARSMSSIFSTVINLSMLSLVQRLH